MVSFFIVQSRLRWISKMSELWAGVERKMSEFGLASMQCLRREIRGVPLLELRLSSYPDGLGCLMGLQMGAVDAERDGSAH